MRSEIENAETDKTQRRYARLAFFLFLVAIVVALGRGFLLDHIAGNGTFAEIAKRIAASWQVLALGAGSTSSSPGSAPIHQTIFAAGATSTGWIDFDFYDEKQIFIPAKVNGHDTSVLLATGLPVPDIDQAFAAAIGVEPKKDPASSTQSEHDGAPTARGLQVQIGSLSLQNLSASVVDFSAPAKHLGHSVPFLLGDDSFENLAVEIDFAHHRIAFRHPASLAKPAGAIEVPLTREHDEHLVPVSLERAPPAEFELGLGNSGEMLVYESYYQSHKVLEGRRSSQRLAAGTGGFFPETVATLNHIKFAGIELANMPAAFLPASVTPGVPASISGDVGLPILVRFHLIIDYPDNRLYAIPYPAMWRKPFPKDRLGLTLNKQDFGFAVRFVAPHSPAESAGFKVGDRITLVGGKPAGDWTETALTDLRYRPAGSSLAFTMEGGIVKHVKLADYF
jgi:hypothetical protein